MESVTCSAPGKILLAGGYLVLDPSYSGLVLSLSARIFTTVSSDTQEEEPCITVTSPQFRDAKWQFAWKDNTIYATSKDDNPFVKEALQTVLTYFDVPPSSFKVRILADNQYYSLPSSSAGRFSKSENSIGDTPKTGLGSSAALTTSLCASLYLYFARLQVTRAQGLPEQDRQVIHNLAQIAHCRAQGKVGSGFDVASAVYGSCTYARFSKDLIERLSIPVDPPELRAVVNQQWSMTIEQVKLRAGLKLIMGDVAQGSSTPGMVKKVLSSSAALDLWPSLAISNDLLADTLTSDEPYDSSEQSNIREIARAVRGLLKRMGVEAEVDIEPDSQTKILDETLLLDGVIATGVPGAGGYDAVFAITTDEEEVVTRVKELWKTRSVKALDLTDDGDGVKLEFDFQPVV